MLPNFFGKKGGKFMKQTHVAPSPLRCNICINICNSSAPLPSTQALPNFVKKIKGEKNLHCTQLLKMQRVHQHVQQLCPAPFATNVDEAQCSHGPETDACHFAGMALWGKIWFMDMRQHHSSMSPVTRLCVRHVFE